MVISANFTPPKCEILPSKDDSSFKRGLIYLRNTAERSVTIEASSGSFMFPRPPFDFLLHQEGVSQAPISYFSKPLRDKSFGPGQRSVDFLIGSTLAAIPKFLAHIATLAITSIALLAIGAFSIFEKVSWGGLDCSKKMFKFVAPVAGNALFGVFREGIRATPVIGHFLAKGADMGKVLLLDGAEKAHDKIIDLQMRLSRSK